MKQHIPKGSHTIQHSE